MNTEKPIYSNKRKKLRTVFNCICWILWIALICLCFYYRNYISTEIIIRFIPKASLFSAAVLLLLFAIKSLSIFIYCGLLYAATAAIFPLPTALVINILGTIIMTSLPYCIGRLAGSPMVDKMLLRFPRLAFLSSFGNKSAFWSAFATRIVGFFPNDPISVVFGAVRVPFIKYLCGSMLGLLPTAIAFTIMGGSISDPSSPAFIVSVVAITLLTIGSAVAFILYKKKHSDKSV